jgi:GTPase SAR1 family protein/RNA polymerase subunit RPABC4/transcription elongation factor Spt4
MGQKLIICGPPAAGKTTLRKIFFEGENSSKFLEYALKPTYGQESVVLNIGEMIGIFDLAGQENERWFESEESAVFYDTKVILVVIDITMETEEIIEFINKVVDIRNRLTSYAMIYVLLHKIDLISRSELTRIKLKIYDLFVNKKLIKFFFTSIRNEYIPETFTNFIEILKNCIADEIYDDQIDVHHIEDVVKFMNLLYKDEFVTKRRILTRMNRSEEIVDYVAENLRDKGEIQYSGLAHDRKYYLTQKGKDYFKEIISNFSLTKFLKEEMTTSDQGTEGSLMDPEFLDSIDMSYSKTLFSKLDELSGEVSQDDETLQGHVKKLKVKLMKCTLSGNVFELRKIAKIISKMTLTYGLEAKEKESHTEEIVYPPEVMELQPEREELPTELEQLQSQEGDIQIEEKEQLLEVEDIQTDEEEFQQPVLIDENLEEQAEADSSDNGLLSKRGNFCPKCGYKVEKTWKSCPTCSSLLLDKSIIKQYCINCGKKIQSDWKTCPYCSQSI